VENAKRLALIALGYFFIGLAILGVFLPILPTAPFLILAAGCFMRSSKRLHDKLLDDKYFGEYLKNWYENGSIPKKAKIVAVISMGITFGSSIYMVPYTIVRVLLILTALCVGAYILTRPTTIIKNK
jgi:hypothetical protein